METDASVQTRLRSRPWMPSRSILIFSGHIRHPYKASGQLFPLLALVLHLKKISAECEAMNVLMFSQRNLCTVLRRHRLELLC